VHQLQNELHRKRVALFLNYPDIFCLTLMILIALSKALLSARMAKSNTGQQIASPSK